MDSSYSMIEVDSIRHQPTEGGSAAPQDDYDSTSSFQSFLRKYREDVEDVDKPQEKRKSVLDDDGILGTSRQFAFTLGERSPKDSILAKYAHIIVDYYSEGVFTMVITSLLKYIMVALLHVGIYSIIPALGEFIRDIDWDTAFLLLNFVVGFIIQGEIRSAASRSSQHPRAAFGFFRYLIHTSRELCEIHHAYTKYGAGTTEDRNGSTQTLAALFANAQYDIVRMTKMVVGFFQELENESTRIVQDEFEMRISRFFGNITALRYLGVISAALEVHYRKGIREHMEPIMSDAGFSKRYVPNTLVGNHLRIVIVIYLWGFVPIQLYASTGFMVIFIYPMMMLIFDMVQVLDRLQGQAFSYQSGQHHPNDYRTWERDALRAIYNACLLARVDAVLPVDPYGYGE